MSRGRYLKPPWMQRHVGNRLSALFMPSMVCQLATLGRRSGRWRTVPVVVLDQDGDRYLVSVRGESDWALDLQASGSGRLTTRGQVEDIMVEGIPVADRPALIEAYLAPYGTMPHVAATFRALPDPGDHPTFRILAPPTRAR